ncbi:MAG TPA: cytochrome D1 domain-containing protein [Terracidiphilus sp.]|nr:cytochrome D1 domain-containing protein [Terracidiphilus sp.]
MRLSCSPPALICLFACSLFVLSTSAQQGRLLVAEKGQQSLAIVDPVSGSVLASVPEGGITGHEVIASPDGKLAFVPIYGNSGVGKPGTDGRTIAVIDIASRKVVGAINFDHGIRPHCPVIGPKDGKLYVTTELDKTITIIDPKTLKIVGTVPTGSEQSHMFAIAHNGLRGYTANVGPGTVSVLDMKAHKVLKIVPISGETQRIAISPNDKWVFTADQKQPRIAVIDTASDTIAHWIPIDAIGYGSAATPDNHWLIMTVPDKDEVAIVDLTTMKVVRTVPVGKYPQEVLVRPDGKIAYVSCEKSNQVAEIDLSTWKTTRLIATGKSTDGVAWAGQ